MHFSSRQSLQHSQEEEMSTEQAQPIISRPKPIATATAQEGEGEDNNNSTFLG